LCRINYDRSDKHQYRLVVTNVHYLMYTSFKLILESDGVALPSWPTIFNKSVIMHLFRQRTCFLTRAAAASGSRRFWLNGPQCIPQNTQSQP